MSEVIKAARTLLGVLDFSGHEDDSDIAFAAEAMRQIIDQHDDNQPDGWPIVCIDFDGVLHSYTSGWKGVDVVADPPVEGAMAWLVMAIEHSRLIPCIYSSRSKESSGIDAMQQWLQEHMTAFLAAVDDRPVDTSPSVAARGLLSQLYFPTEKPAAHLTIDDRGWSFTGTFPTAEEIFDFKPWNKK